jgi:hypothetical protein
MVAHARNVRLIGENRKKTTVWMPRRRRGWLEPHACIVRRTAAYIVGLTLARSHLVLCYWVFTGLPRQ